MPIDLADYEQKIKEAVKAFWGNREAARLKQIEVGKTDQGERGAVTGGKNMDGFVSLVCDLVEVNGLSTAIIQRERKTLTLPGYFRPTKLWDLLVLNNNRLVAALEFKSQIGPSFGNNFNNRTEEAIGTAHDLWTAYREGAFGEIPRPFVGWFMLVEDAAGSRAPVRDASPNFPVFPEFKNASYIARYDILCKKLVQEQLYTTATVLTSSRGAIDTGEHQNVSEMTGLLTFISSFAGHIAAEAARTNNSKQ
ncbi:MAG: PaeR7I family type II restriction endonuclease [Pyrinomonadaceae bacterium]